ncbi:MAG TPA: transglutaminase-like cysteine peptidase [Sulfurimonas sp.]|nr:transglutaminase-like cysteine peptidase [Sulfurimonas sp.]
MLRLKKFILLLLFVASSLLSFEPFTDKELLPAIEQKHDTFAKERAFLLQERLDMLRGKSDLQKLEGVNDFFNEIEYASDIQISSKGDYLATPWEFLCNNLSDSEDYVMSKYFALKYLKVDHKKLFFTYVRSTKFEEPHMVLTYFETPRSEPLILDNDNRKIFPASKRDDLTPIYNFNGDTLYKVGKNSENSYKK